MGIGASVKKPKGSVILPVSPRVEYAEKTGNTGVLDSPALLDLGHGTVRYRQKETTSPALEDTPLGQSDSSKQKTVKTGYFYHAKINSFSQPEPEENFKTFYVSKGPKVVGNKKLFYVYGKGWGAQPDEGLRKMPYRPQGRGYQWPDSFQNLSFSLTVRTDQEPLGDDSDVDDDLSTSDSDQLDEYFEVAVRDSDTVLELKQRLSQRFLRSTEKIQLKSEGRLLTDDSLLCTLKPKETGLWNRFLVQLAFSYK